MVEIRIISYNSDEYKQSLELRDLVLRKPLGLNLSEADVEGEENQIHIAAVEDKNLVGCVVIAPIDSTTAKVRNMTVHPDRQGLGVGKDLMFFAEKIAKEKGFSQLTMHARKTAVRFYEKLGYIAIGDEFLEHGIPHIIMEKCLL